MKFPPQQTGAAGGLRAKRVAKPVILDQRRIALRQQVARRRRQHQAVQGILVGFEADIRDELGHALVTRDRLAALPVRRINDLLEARQQHRIEVIGHLDQDVFASPAVLPVQVDDRMAGGAGASEEIQNRIGCGCIPGHYSSEQRRMFFCRETGKRASRGYIKPIVAYQPVTLRWYIILNDTLFVSPDEIKIGA